LLEKYVYVAASRYIVIDNVIIKSQSHVIFNTNYSNIFLCFLYSKLMRI